MPRFLIPIFSVVLGLSVFSALIGYLMFGFSIYFLAKKQSLKNPLLAFVPIARFWMGGLLCDDAAARFGKRYTMRIWIPILSVISRLGSTLSLSTFWFFFHRMFPGEHIFFRPIPDHFLDILQSLSSHTGLFLLVQILTVLFSLAGLAALILEFVGVWPVLQLHDPGNATLFLVLSIVVQLLFSLPLLPILLLCVGCKALKTPSLPPVDLP